ncbi:MAG: hypothetical protein U1E61_05445 [Bradyrhizobium sp.]
MKTLTSNVSAIIDRTAVPEAAANAKRSLRVTASGRNGQAQLTEWELELVAAAGSKAGGGTEGRWGQ